tara:strand:+ start:4678 stop:5772 length:1095 start_codon:yes stop_codon:yes gene_type:complete
MRSLKIIHTEASEGFGGQEKRILLESLSLIAKGHKILIVGQPNSRLGKEAESRSIPFCKLRMRFSWDLISFFKFIFLIFKYKPDLIHTHSSIDSWIGGLVGRLMRIPVFRTRHVSVPIKGHTFNLVYRLPRKIFTTAEVIKKLLISSKSCDPSKIEVVPTGVDTSVFNRDISKSLFKSEMQVPEETLLVGMVAQLRGSKGHLDFLEAIRQLSSEKARFYIIGDGEGRDLYEKKAAESNLLNSRVFFLGYREDIPTVMAGLDLLVIASTRTEGIPQVALQSMSMGVPIVGTNIGGVPEVLFPSKAGLVVPSKDSMALANGIRILLKNKKIRERMGNMGQEFVDRNFSLEKMIKRTLFFYEEVISD